MKLRTDFWGEEKFEFDTLYYINGSTMEIMYTANLKDVWNTFKFFKDIAAFVKTKRARKTLFNSCWKNEDYYQFAVMVEGKMTHIKWFDLIIDENTVISHDAAYDTTLVKKNGLYLSFGGFPTHIYYRNPHAKLPLYREFNIQARAYKYFANQIKILLKHKSIKA